MNPEQARQEAYDYSFSAFDEYIQEMTDPATPAGQCLQMAAGAAAEEEEYDPTAVPQILAACYRLALQLYRQSNLPDQDELAPEYPDSPRGVTPPTPNEILSAIVATAGE